jgi:hypothetical protein
MMPAGSIRRLPVVAVVVVAVLVALVAGNADPEPVAEVAKPDSAVELAAAGTRSSAWFCPGFPGSVPLEAQSITISNLGDDDADVVLTVSPDDGSAAATQDIAVPAGAISALPRASLGPAGGTVVESFSRDITVEQGVESPAQLAVGPCATVAAADWFFAAGTTGNYSQAEGQPVEQWLSLFNPFGTDARVEITLRLADRVIELGEAIDVPRRTRVLVPLHESSVGEAREPRVAVAVHATAGRVVAEQSMIFGEESGATGITLSLGALAPAPSWTFADGETTDGARNFIAVVNTGLVDTDVDIAVSAAETPLTVPLERDRVRWIQIGGCADPAPEDCLPVPPDTRYSTIVSTDADTPIVAEQLAFFDSDATGEGVATVMGISESATRAVVGRAGVASGRGAFLAIANPGAVAVSADVTIMSAGGVAPPTFRNIEIGPNQRVEFDLTTELAGQDAALGISANRPVAVSRSIYSAGDASRAAAIPDRR